MPGSQKIFKKYLEQVLACSVLFLAWAPLHGQVSVLTWHNDNARTGQNLQETVLTPANVNASTFGKLFVIQADGKVDGQPLYVPGVAFPGNSVHNTLYVVTEHDTAYAFDADTGAGIWHVSLLGQNETTSDDRGCGQVIPEIGIAATPVIDPQIGPHGTMYAVAMSKDGSGNYHQRLHALDLTTGAEQFGAPVEIRATYPGSGSEPIFDAKVHKGRPGLLIVNGIVYTSWGSHCDIGSYNGWLIGYSETTLAQVSVLNLVPNGGDGGIWASGAGPAADASGNIFLATGNGTFDAALTSSGFPARGDYGNAFVKISTVGGNPTVTDYFTMSNTTPESNEDLDLGSGGLMLLPMLNDAQGNPHALAVGGGKDGNIYIVDQNNLGKFNPNRNSIYQQLTAEPIFSSAAWFNGTLYYGPIGSSLKAFVFTNGVFGPAPASESATAFGSPGTTPSISANGTSNAVVWAAENGTKAVLHAYDARDLSRELYNSNQATNARDQFGEGNKFIVPTVANGKVYVGTTTGVGVFGLLASATQAPVISSVTNAAGSASDSSLLMGIVPNSWVSIMGTNLSPTPDDWSHSVIDGVLPASLDGVSVMIGGKPAYISYISPGQINVAAPDAALGPVTVTVTNSAGTSAPFTVTSSEYGPAFFLWPENQAVATHLDYSYAVKAGTFAGVTTTPAKPGETIVLWGTGFGPTIPAAPFGVAVPANQTYNTSTRPMITFNNSPVMVLGAALVSGAAALYQIAIQVPSSMADGDWPILATIGGVTSPAGIVLTVKQ